MPDTLHILRVVVPRVRDVHAVTYRALSYTTNNTKYIRRPRPRTYATNTSLGTTPGTPGRPHKRVTLFNDDGHVKWGDLSPMEKAARTTQQSFNFGLVIGGVLLTAGVFTLLYTDVFSPQSSTAHFNRAVDRIRSDPRMHDLLGPSNSISAYGEPSWNKWRRNRPIASQTGTDKFGTERMYMHFHVSGPLGEGVAHLFVVRRRDESHFNYGYLAVDVRGHQRVYLENADVSKATKNATPGTFLGFKWS